MALSKLPRFAIDTKLRICFLACGMKRIDCEIEVLEVEIPTLKDKPKKIGFTFKANAFPVHQLNEWKNMVFVVDGELNMAYLLGYRIGDKEYFVGDNTPRLKKPRKIELYKY